MSQDRSSSSSEISTDSNTERPDVLSTGDNRVPELSNERDNSTMLIDRPVKRGGKRPGRKPSKIDVKAKLERSRQSARECRARKKLRYQYLEELVLNREQAIFSLRDELEVYKQWCIQVDKGIVNDKLLNALREDTTRGEPLFSSRQSSSSTGSAHSSRQTSTVTSSTQSLYKSSSVQELPSLQDFGSSTRSRSFEYPPNYGSSTFQGSSMSSQLHGSGVQVHDANLQYQNPNMTSTHMTQYAGSTSASIYQGQGHYDYMQGSHGNTMQGSHGNISYQPPVTTQEYITLGNVGQEDPMTTLTSITTPGPVLPSYDMAVSYNVQPSTSQTTSTATSEAASWYHSLLAELEPGLARQGAESASGTPQSVDGVRTLPTVLHDFADTDSSSDT